MADPAFDPSQPFEALPAAGAPTLSETQPSAPVTFDPGKPFDVVDQGNPATAGAQHSVAQPSPSLPNNAPSQSWGDALGEAAGNIIPSAEATGKAIVTPLLHPVDTAKSLASTAVGGAQELDDALGVNGSNAAPTDDTKHFDALKDYFVNRYGSIDNLKHTVATDPVGFGTDIAAVLTGGETVAAKIPGLAGKAAEISGAVGKTLAPVAKTLAPVTGAISKGADWLAAAPGNAAAQIVGNITTGAGANSIKAAYKAGLTGGDAAKAFTGNMRGTIPWSQVVTDAKTALGNMRNDRNAAYRSGMTDVSQDQSILDFQPIDEALENVNSINSYKGQDLSPNTTAVRQDIFSAVNQWKGLDPAEYHTPEGFDALKQKIGDIKDAQPFGTPQRTIASDVYNAVRGTIADQAPAYDKVMTDYSTASDQLSDLQKELSLGKNGNPNTALRKLQSTMRNNVNTSFGNRTKQAETLAANSAPNLMPALAGQALSAPIPRGLAKYGDLGAVAGIGMANLPAAAGMLAASSPRLMGEAAYGLGRAGRAISPVAKAAAPIGKYAAQRAPMAYEVANPLSFQDDATPPNVSNATNILENIANPEHAPYAAGGRVHEAANEADPEPSDAQIEAGNYRKGHVVMHGFDLTIETPQGAARRGFRADGAMWENRHPTAHYGYIKKTVGADDEHVDAYIGPDHASTRIFVVNQFNPATKKFDEHKLVFGAKSPKQARAVYDGGFSDGSGPKRRWAVHEIDSAGLKAWLASGRTKRPFPARLAA